MADEIVQNNHQHKYSEKKATILSNAANTFIFPLRSFFCWQIFSLNIRILTESFVISNDNNVESIRLPFYLQAVANTLNNEQRSHFN